MSLVKLLTLACLALMAFGVPVHAQQAQQVLPFECLP